PAAAGGVPFGPGPVRRRVTRGPGADRGGGPPGVDPRGQAGLGRTGLPPAAGRVVLCRVRLASARGRPPRAGEDDRRLARAAATGRLTCRTSWYAARPPVAGRATASDRRWPAGRGNARAAGPRSSSRRR